MSEDEEMINGEAVEVRYPREDWWYRGTVFKARKMQVELTEACDPDTRPPDKGEVADESTIAEWRRPGEAKTYRNSLVSES